LVLFGLAGSLSEAEHLPIVYMSEDRTTGSVTAFGRQLEPQFSIRMEVWEKLGRETTLSIHTLVARRDHHDDRNHIKV
jgi:hypothetical protein